MARLVISLLLASAVADDQRLRGAQTAGSFSMAHRSGGRHASFGITPIYDDGALITCEGNEGKCIGPEGVIEGYGEMECNTVTSPFLVADPENDGLKCGPKDGPNNRTFKFTNTTDDGIYFNVDVCKAACAEDPDCVAMSLGFGTPKDKTKPDYWWCIGCSEELDEAEVQTVAAYKKADPFCGGVAVDAESECDWTFCPGSPVIIDDPGKNNTKCGKPKNLLRSFKISGNCPGGDPQCVTNTTKASDEELCKAACLNDETCVAVSQGVHDSTAYCIGCQVPLWFDFEGATAYKKVQTTDL